MARPQKVGLDYFPVDIDIFNDPKVETVTSMFGPVGDGILIRLLCRIYRDGYCTVFNEDVARSIARQVGERELFPTVTEVVEELLHSGFFHEGLYRQYGILTSRGIQARYEKVCTDCGRKNNKVPGNHSLLGRKPQFTGEETPQSKGKETKEEEITSPNDDDDDVLVITRARARGVRRTWQEVFGRAPTPAQLEVMARWVHEYGDIFGMQQDVFDEAMRRAATVGAANPIGYISTLLGDWKSQRLRTLDDIDVMQYQFDHAAGKV